jgi:hypothetical protein
MTRTKNGIVLPGPSSSVAAASPAAATPAPSPVAAPAASPAASSAQPQLQIASLRVSKGRLDFDDRGVEPPVEHQYRPIEIDARDLRYPKLAAGPIRVDISGAEQGTLKIDGSFPPDEKGLELNIDQLALPPFNPYATAYSAYSITDGSVTLVTKVKPAGDKYKVKNTLTLHQLGLGGAESDSGFEQQFGIPVSMALALMRDVQGNITLNIPVSVDRSGAAEVSIAAVVRSALRRAVTGAIESPLKLLGAVGGRGKAGPIAPAPIAFHTGTAEPMAEGVENAARLASFLSGRPTMSVRLDTAITTGDVRWLREQALAAQWQDESFFSSLTFLTKRGARENIRRALAARAKDEPGQLSPEDTATLDQWLAERPPPSLDQLRALASDRVARVEKVLKEKGIDAARISRGEVSDEPVEGPAKVKMALGLASGANAPTPSPTPPSAGNGLTDSAP